MKKKFTVRLITKGGYSIEISRVDTSERDVYSISYDDVWDILDYGDYIADCGLGDEWSGQFSLTACDENGDTVFESNDFSDFRLVIDKEDIPGNIPDDMLQQIVQECEKRWDSEKGEFEDGIYVAAFHEMKWQEFEFTVEDEHFDPARLLFVANKELEGLVYDYMTDPGHILYGGTPVDVKYFDESEDEYGTSAWLVRREDDGCWSQLREICPE